MSQINQHYQNKALTYCLGNRRGEKIWQILSGYKGKRVLDLGCSTGYIGRDLKKNGNYVVGVDISKPAIIKAKNILDEAYVLDLEGNSNLLGKKKFDLIIIAELIEHLFLPETLIQNLVRNNLANNGEILISTPNFLHFINRVKFLLGKFKYENSGMFDKSHIHFFTYTGLIGMIRSANLNVVKENSVIVPRLLGKVGARFPSLFAYQFVILAKKL